MSEDTVSRVVYEHPLNERYRALLRLEFLLATVETAMERHDPLDSRTAVEALLATLGVLDRSELRGELIKELDRLAGSLKRIEEEGRKTSTQEEIATCRALLARIGDPAAAVGQLLREDELLVLIAQRFGVGAGTANFELPSYHLWLSRPYHERLADLQRWHDSLADLRDTVGFALRMQRQMSPLSEELAHQGAWQCRTPHDGPNLQLLRLHVPIDDPVIPEISGNRHLMTIRFLRQPSTLNRPEPVREEIPFRLTRCDL